MGVDELKPTAVVFVVAVFVLSFTVEGVNVTVRPVAGFAVDVRATVSLIPELTRVRVAEAVLAELNVTLAGVKPIVKAITVTGTVTE